MINGILLDYVECKYFFSASSSVKIRNVSLDLTKALCVLNMATFQEIKARCIKENKLFEDVDFPSRNTSINPDCDNPGDWLWRRPIVSIVKHFIVYWCYMFRILYVIVIF